MKLYLAGPMRGIKEFNFPAFIEATDALRFRGHEVFNPAERDIDAGFQWRGLTGTMDELADLGFDLRAALGADLEWITAHAEGVVVLPGWENSSGARAEVATAKALGLEVFDYVGIGNIAAQSNDAPPAPTELRIVNETTGGAKGSKTARFDLLPAGPLRQVAEHYGKGAEKYEARNWERGYDWSLSFAALQRHAWQFWAGEDIDVETGSHHMAAVVFHAFALMQFGLTCAELDDRAVTA